MYGRINENGALETYGKRYVRVGSRLVVNPGKEVMLSLGYKPIEAGEAPTAGRGEALVLDYVDKGDRIEAVFSIIRR